MGSRSLKGQLLAQRAPLLMVRSHPEAEHVCLKSGLSFAELLRPFTHLRNLNVPIRTAGDHPPYRLTSLPLRVAHWSVIAPCAFAKAADEALAHNVTQCGEELAPRESWSQAKEFEELLETRYEDPNPWFNDYQTAFFDTLCFAEHESFDHPVASLLVLPSSVEDPVAGFLALDRDARTVPPLLAEGLADPAVLKHYVLLHDLQTGSAERAEEMLLELRTTFGHSACQLVCLNSGPAARPGPDVWSATLDPLWTRQSSDHPRPAHQGDAPGATAAAMGACLTAADLLGLETMVRDFATKALLPHLETRVCSLNQVVAATRKGLKNQLKNLWWRKERREGDETPEGGPVYTHQAPEVQLRVLADLAFLLQDYELALAHYRLAAADFKADKAWKRYAAVQEAAGLALFMLDGGAREIEASLESAFTTYTRFAQSVPTHSRQFVLRYATRSMLLLGAMQRALGLFREATVPFMRASYEEVPLRAALLLEQAALCYLQASPPLVRKFGFYMVLAGHRYNHSGQRWHAIRAYAAVLPVYRAHNWRHLEEHLHFALARQVAHMGDLEGAVGYFVQLLRACSHQPPTMQATYLREFLYIVQSLADKLGGGGGAAAEEDADTEADADLPMPPPVSPRILPRGGRATTPTAPPIQDLPLPHIDPAAVRVHFQDHRCYASAAARNVPEAEWAALEAPLLPLSQDASTWLDNPGSRKAEKESNTVVAGEYIWLDVAMTNPLQAPLDVSGVRLVCEYTAPDGTALLDPAAPAAADELVLVAQPGASAFGPGEAKVVRLGLRPLREGALRVCAVHWVLCGVAHGVREFPAPPALPRVASQARLLPATPAHRCLTFNVVPPTPRLAAVLEGLPATLYEGELQQCTLCLSNVGGPGCDAVNLRLAASSAALLPDRAPSGAALEPPPKKTENAPPAPNAYAFPATTLLTPGDTPLRWPVWLRVAEAGTLELCCSVYCEPRTRAKGAAISFRMLRMQTVVEVAPSLRVWADAAACGGSLQTHLLRLHVQNLHPTRTFRLRRVAALPPATAIAAAAADATPVDGATAARAAMSIAPLPGTPAALDDDDDGAAAAAVLPGLAVRARTSLCVRLSALQLRDNMPGPHSVTLEVGGAALAPDGHGPEVEWPVGQYHRREAEQAAAAAPPLPRRGGGKGSGEGTDKHIDLLVQWQVAVPRTDAAAGLHLGMHYVVRCPLAAAATVRCMLAGPHRIAHTFAADGACVVPLKLQVVNGTAQAVAVRLQAAPCKAAEARTAGSATGTPDDATTVLHGAPSGVSSAEICTWIGATRKLVPQLEAGASTVVALRLAVLAPGTVALPNWWVSWAALTGEEKDGQLPPLAPPAPCEGGGAKYLLSVMDLDSEASSCD